MSTYICLAIVCLIVIILLIRLFQYKRQIRLFTKLTKKRKDLETNQAITIEYFDKDIIELANILNEYTAMQKRLALQYQEDRKQLKNVIAGISHDFRTPLTAVKGYLQLIEKNQRLTDKDAEYLSIALEKTTYLKELSDSFFEVSALEAKEEIEIVPVHFYNLLSEQILAQYTWMEERKIKTEFLVPEEDYIVHGNEHVINRILENLFSNVKKYVKSYIKIQLKEEKESLVFSIENDVEDVEQVDVENVFEPFYRNHARHSEGSGLGLYVVKRLADQMEYQVFASGENQKFKITLVLH